MSKPHGGKGGGRLTAEERLLEKQRAEILRKQQELEKRLKILPVVMEEQEEQKRQLAKRRAEAASPPISPYLGRTGPRGRNRKGQRRMPSRERQIAKMTTLALVVILAVIVFMLWQTIPTK